jgi:hypothetical protein
LPRIEKVLKSDTSWLWKPGSVMMLPSQLLPRLPRPVGREKTLVSNQ